MVALEVKDPVDLAVRDQRAVLMDLLAGLQVLDQAVIVHLTLTLTGDLAVPVVSVAEEAEVKAKINVHQDLVLLVVLGE
jgi:hypothetical protein